MGIGDQTALLAAIQGVGDKVGEENITIWYDPAYPGSADVFEMGGIDSQPIAGAQEYPSGLSVILCRHHIMDSPIGAEHRCCHGEHTGNPLDEVYFSWGWHKLIQGGGVHPRLFPNKGAVKEAQQIAANNTPFTTCTPIEVSRHNNHCKDSAWGNILNQIDRGGMILFGCAPKENDTLGAMIADMNIRGAYQIINVPLQTWKALIDLADANYTGNSCGMWLSMASKTKTYLLQHDDPNHTHNRMWNYKENWKCGNIKIINV